MSHLRRKHPRAGKREVLDEDEYDDDERERGADDEFRG
jgi:hypothetical protein